MLLYQKPSPGPPPWGLSCHPWALDTTVHPGDPQQPWGAGLILLLGSTWLSWHRRGTADQGMEEEIHPSVSFPLQQRCHFPLWAWKSRPRFREQGELIISSQLKQEDHCHWRWKGTSPVSEQSTWKRKSTLTLHWGEGGGSLFPWKGGWGRSLVAMDVILSLKELLNCEHAEVVFQAEKYLLSWVTYFFCTLCE